MEKIILKGKETNQQLRDLLEDRKAQYSRLDNKSKLLERVNDYNNSIDVVKKISKKKDVEKTEEIKGESIQVVEEDVEVMIPEISENFIGGVPLLTKEEINGYKLYTGSQYCNIKGVNKRTRFFIKKKYKDITYTSSEWDEIFIKEKLV